VDFRGFFNSWAQCASSSGQLGQVTVEGLTVREWYNSAMDKQQNELEREYAFQIFGFNAGGKGDILLFCLASWASAGSQREFQAHATRGFLLPGFTSEWSPALDTSPRCCEFS
jgi:hypothetical protein